MLCQYLQPVREVSVQIGYSTECFFTAISNVMVKPSTNSRLLKDGRLLICDAVYLGVQFTAFQRAMLPPS